MAQLLVRHLDDDVKAKLQRRARRHGRSIEEEVREILRNAVREESAARAPLGSRLAARFAGVGLREDIPELRGQPAGGLSQRGWRSVFGQARPNEVEPVDAIVAQELERVDPDDWR
jgi:plasmid stability protein